MEKLRKILTELRRQMNGAVSQSMREMGQREALNFGVSLPTIKEIAQRYTPDHDLADELSIRKSREAKIAALYVADPQLLTAAQMEKWSKNWETQEIARLSAMLLFHKSPDAEKIAFEWIEQEGSLHQISALYIIGRIAPNATNALIEKALSIENLSSDAATYSLRELFRSREELRPRISEIAEQNAELMWQISEF